MIFDQCNMIVLHRSKVDISAQFNIVTHRKLWPNFTQIFHCDALSHSPDGQNWMRSFYHLTIIYRRWESASLIDAGCESTHCVSLKPRGLRSGMDRRLRVSWRGRECSCKARSWTQGTVIWQIDIILCFSRVDFKYKILVFVKYFSEAGVDLRSSQKYWNKREAPLLMQF